VSDATPAFHPRRIYARYDEAGIGVYQAFSTEIVEAAVRGGRFGKGFNLDRMTWIKPSWGWMLYRSGYATKHRQERIVRVTLSHAGFLEILATAVPTTFDRDRYTDPIAWRQALHRSEVRVQWDPDRDWRLRRLERRAIQLGIRGSLVRRYVEEWTLGIEDVTELAHRCGEASRAREKEVGGLPEERVYSVPEEIAAALGMDRVDQ
jgi:hypothetical protein